MIVKVKRISKKSYTKRVYLYKKAIDWLGGFPLNVKFEFKKEKGFFNIKPVKKNIKVVDAFGMGKIGWCSHPKLVLVESGELYCDLITHFKKDYLKCYCNFLESVSGV